MSKIRSSQLVLDNILLIGDSITQMAYNPQIHGWVGSLQNDWIRYFDVLNRGYSGYNSKWWKHIIEPTLENAQNPAGVKIALAILFLGANDCANQEQQAVPLEDYEKNILFISNEILKVCPRLLLISPAPVDSEKWPDRPYSRVKEYRDTVIKLGEKLKCPVLDTWSGFLGDDLEFNQSVMDYLYFDGLHFGSEGNKLFFKLVKAKILESWPEINPEKLAMKPNEWRHVDNHNLPFGIIKK
jgi:lysophospholipase L1-like esterase